MSRSLPLQQGFSLVELAVVLVVIAFVLGGMLLPLATQVDARKVQETRAQLQVIKQALVGFAQVNGRLPCPATHLTNGAEMPVQAGGCWDNNGGVTRQHGFVPAVDLGINGSFYTDPGEPRTVLLADAWGNPFRYSVTNNSSGGTAAWDFVNSVEMRTVGIAALTPDLVVCNSNAASPPDTSPGSPSTTACAAPGDMLTGEAPAVFFSTGPDGAEMSAYTFQSRYQLENTGESTFLTRQLGGFWIASDPVFVAGPRRGEPDSSFAYFDDLVEWISPVVLYERMIAAGRLP